jgi:TPP-dependent pyruvate/acetoin dehydrogenase alpha subunit
MSIHSQPEGLVRVLPLEGLAANTRAPQLAAAEHRSMFRSMLLIRMLDEKMLMLQRQGRIAFFGPSAGQEAAIIGSGSVARKDDWVFPALREAGIALHRGFPLEQYFGQLFGNVLDPQQGRQQPMHFSSGAVHYVSLSSPIATQLPQATGAAVASKLRGDGAVIFAYLGDGATSEHDFHSALNFAAVWKAPVIFLCQNNGWAISVPFEKQTASLGVAVKAAAYGMPGIAVDGNDVLAVRTTTELAFERARRGEGPALLEFVTWRRGGHSSSDDPTRYRDEASIPPWVLVDPLERYRAWLRTENLLSASDEEVIAAELKSAMDEGIAKAEHAERPDLESMFRDVTKDMSPALTRQMMSADRDTSGKAEGAFPL